MQNHLHYKNVRVTDFIEKERVRTPCRAAGILRCRPQRQKLAASLHKLARVQIVHVCS